MKNIAFFLEAVYSYCRQLIYFVNSLYLSMIGTVLCCSKPVALAFWKYLQLYTFPESFNAYKCSPDIVVYKLVYLRFCE